MHNYVLSTSTMVNDLFPMLIIVFARDFDYNKVLVYGSKSKLYALKSHF